MLAAFDAQIRRDPPPTPGVRVERTPQVVRVGGVGWDAVVWSSPNLSADELDEVIAAQVAHSGGSFEWKHYSYDSPALAGRLRAAGLVPGPAETLMVAEIADLDLDVPPPDGIELAGVDDEDGVAALVRVHEQVFGGDRSDLGEVVREGLRHDPRPVEGVLALADGVPVCAGRVELAAGTEFASLWGGGTLAPWRGRGVFRALVSRRAAIAAAHGYRYLQVDALPTSRPILRRLGFAELATTTPWTRPGESG